MPSRAAGRLAYDRDDPEGSHPPLQPRSRHHGRRGHWLATINLGCIRTLPFSVKLVLVAMTSGTASHGAAVAHVVHIKRESFSLCASNTEVPTSPT